MSIIFDQAMPEIHDMAKRILHEHHPELQMGFDRDNKPIYVRLCILMATNADPESEEPAIKGKSGWPAAAQISIIPYKQRVDKRADAEILIDSKWWDKATERQRTATLDHEITHLEIEIDKDGAVKTDDQGRPKLRLRLHDWEIAGFRSIAERYGDDALEVVCAREFDKKFGPLVSGTADLYS